MATVPVEDRLAIHELTYRYVYYCDTKNLPALMTLFLGDAFLDETQLGLGVSRGADGIQQAFEKLFAAAEVFHMCSNHVIEEFSPSTAAGICLVYAECELAPSGERIRSHGYFRDEYAKSRGEWLFKSRTLIPILKTNLGSYGKAAATAGDI